MKILDELLAEYGCLNTHNEIYAVVQRYLNIKHGKKENGVMVSRAYDNGHIRFGTYANYDDVVVGEDGVRLNTKETPMEQYFDKIEPNLKHVVICYKDRECTIIFRNTNDAIPSITSVVMQLMAVYPKLMPWLSPTIDEEDKAFIKALAECDYAAVTKITDEMVTRILGDFRQAYKLKAFETFKINTTKNALAFYSNKITNYNNDIADLSRKLANMYRELAEAQDVVRLLQSKDETKDDSLLKFFKQHKQINVDRYDSNYVRFTVNETIQNYSKFIENYLERTSTTLGSAPVGVRKIIKYCLVDKKAKIHTYAKFELTNEGVVFVSDDSTNSGTDVGMPHPHLIRFGCLGTNGAELDKYNSQYEWDMAIEQVIAATRNINIDDLSAMNEFIQSIRNHRTSKYYELPDGRFVDAVELITIIDEENKQ